MRLFAYCRVSPNDEKERNTIPNQEIAIKQYATTYDHQIAAWFMDVDVSGVAEERPKFDELILRINEADGVICTYMDRFGRSLIEILNNANHLKKQKKHLIFSKQALDTSTAHGRLLFHILGAFAEFEREMIRERSLAGIARALAEGIHCGRPKKRIERHKLEEYLTKELSWADIGRIFDMDPRTVQRIAEEHDLLQKV